jgi:hypothetical protein
MKLMVVLVVGREWRGPSDLATLLRLSYGVAVAVAVGALLAVIGLGTGREQELPTLAERRARLSN